MKHQKLETTPEISERMANVKLKRGKAETVLAKALWHQGFRYLRNFRKLPGYPDIAITKYKIAIFIDGEFWHGYNWEHQKSKFKSNSAYWIDKIEENMTRDKRNDSLLKEAGWVVIHFWEREIKNNLDSCVKQIMEVAEG